MGDVIQLGKLDKPPPSPVPRVCATCAFYSPGWAGECHAFGGVYAATSWLKCKGQYWMQKPEKVSWIRKIKNFFTRQ